MQVLITGGAGFIGSSLARRLVAEGHQVRVLDDLSTGRLENLDGLRVDVVQGTITDEGTVRDALGRSEVVFHLAALPSVTRSVANPAATHAANATGTLNVLTASRDTGVRRVVYASSSSVYGNTPVLPKREDMATEPMSPYAVAKLAGEHYARAFTEVYGMETITLRYFNVYGPRQISEGGYGAVVPRFVSAALAGQAPTIFGSGEQSRDFTFVGDAVQANLLAASAPAAVAGEVFNVACHHRTSLLELWRIIAGETGCNVAPVHREPRVGDVRDSLADISKAQQILGYAPEHTLDEGLRDTIAWFANRASAQLPDHA